LTSLGDRINKKVNPIETERLFLKGITEEDAVEIVTWRSDPEVYKYFKNPHKITVQEHLRWYHGNYLYDDSRYDWVCIEKDTGQKIGVFGLIRKDTVAEVNYLLCPEAQHKGYAAEGINGLIRFAKDVWDIHQFIAEIHKDNEASISLAKKLGFRLQNDEAFAIYLIER